MDLLSWVSQPDAHVGENNVLSSSGEAILDDHPHPPLGDGQKQQMELLRMDVDGHEVQTGTVGSDAPSPRPEAEPVNFQELQAEDGVLASDAPILEPEVKPADMDVQILEDNPRLRSESESESPATKRIRRVDIAVELLAMNMERRKEFELIEEPDDGFDGNEVSLDGRFSNLWRSGGFGGDPLRGERFGALGDGGARALLRLVVGLPYGHVWLLSRRTAMGVLVQHIRAASKPGFRRGPDLF